MRQTIEIVLNHPVVKRLHLADFLWSSSWSSDDDFFTLMVPQIFSHCWWDSKEASSWETIGYRPLVFHIGYLKMLFYSNKSPQVLTLNLFSFKSFATSVMKRRQVWNKARHGNWLRFVHHAIKFARERGWLPQKLPCADSLVVDDHPCRLFMFMTCDRCAFLLHLDDDELLYPEVRRGNSWRSRDTDGSPCQVLTPTQRWSEPGTFASSCSLPFEFWTKEFPHVVFVWIYRVVTACDVCHGESAMSQLTFSQQPCPWTVRHTIFCCISEPDRGKATSLHSSRSTWRVPKGTCFVFHIAFE